jgi:hypothetical protein
MTKFGNSRISVDVQEGGIGGLNLSTTDKLVIFGRGDPSTGSVSPNDPTRVSGPLQLEPTFGNSRVADAMRDAGANGQSFDAMFGVLPERVAVSNELVSDGTGTLTDSDGDASPVIEDTDLIEIQNTTVGQSETAVFRYESPLDTSSLASGEVAINPDTGEVAAGDSDDYEVDYEYLEWEDAFNSATQIIRPQETGQWCVLSDSESVINDAVGAVTPLRENQFKMIRVIGGAEPNQTVDGKPQISPTTYTDSVADAATFLFGPVRESSPSDVQTALGGIAGEMSSISINESIIGESVNSIGDLQQQMPIPTQEALKDLNVIALSNFGDVTIEGNTSTSDSTRRQTYFTRRLADRLILTARAIARTARGKVGTPPRAGQVQSRLEDEIVDLADQGLLEDNSGEETKFFVDARADPENARRLLVDFGFTPEGIVDQVQFSAVINI